MARLHVPGDGASWIWKGAERALTGCRQALDIYHVSGHIAAAGQRLIGDGTAAATASHKHGRDLLLEEGWAGVCRLISEELRLGDTPPRRAALDRMLGYFVSHIGRLAYAGRLAAGEAIGSGVVEGATKALGLRQKARGARRRYKDSHAMAALICGRHTYQWEWSRDWAA